jgi:hypothetical protein
MTDSSEQKPRDFYEVNMASMESTIAEAERLFALGHNRRDILAGIYNWGSIHEMRRASRLASEAMNEMLKRGREISEKGEALHQEFTAKYGN